MSDEKTIFNFSGNQTPRPTPGQKNNFFDQTLMPGLSTDMPQQGQSQAASMKGEVNWQAAQFQQMNGYNDKNIYLKYSAQIFNIIKLCRQLMVNNNVDQLRDHLISEIKSFDQNMKHAHNGPQETLIARYILCTFIDESIVTTPWGGSSNWSQKSLLNVFHNEGDGGEKFFQLLSKLQQETAKYIDILELMFVCLCLGFEGKYRLLDRGTSAVEQVRDDLFRTIRMYRGDYERQLSTHWQGITDTKNKLMHFMPWWVLVSLCGVALLTIYTTFVYVLETNVDPVEVTLETLINPSYFVQSHINSQEANEAFESSEPEAGRE